VLTATGRARLAGFGAALIAFGAVMSTAPAQPAAAANISFEQCKGVSNTGGLTVQCDVVIVNNLTENPLTTGSIVIVNGGAPVASADLVTSVNQCNGSANGGGGTLLCTVTITNNITVSGASAPTPATINQCNDNQPDGLGTAPNLCLPFPATTTGSTITQCNGSGNGGGLVFPSGCTAAGTISSALPVTVNQCNGSANGGGTRIVCSTAIVTNLLTVDGTTTTVGPTTTVAPTTVAPTTVAPTTVAPTTVAPTTVAPTTVAATTTTPSVTTAPQPPVIPPGTLPQTGSTTTSQSLVGLAFLLAGGSLMFVVRRRRTA